MGSRGPAPKLGEKLGHRTQAELAMTHPGDGIPKAWALPPGKWLPQSVLWWEAVIHSTVAEVAWRDEDRPLIERTLWLVDQWWRMTERAPAEAVRAHGSIMQAEKALYLGPAERARAGINTPPPDVKPTASGASSRARLRAVEEPGALD